MAPRKEVPFIVQEGKPSKPIPTNQKNFFRPETFLRSFREEEYFSDILVGIKHVIQGHMEDLQRGFQSQCHSLELEVKKRDDIIAKLQHRIQELENPLFRDSIDDDIPDAPFMRGDSVDTVLFSPPRTPPVDEEEAEDEDEEDEDVDLADRMGNRSRGPHDEDDDDDHNANVSARHRDHEGNHSDSTSHYHDTSTDEGEPATNRRISGRQLVYRRSWEDHSEEEHMELQDLPPSMSPQAVWSNVNGGARSKPDAVVLNIGLSDASSNEDEFDEEGDLYPRDDEEELQFRGHQGDWEVQMLARELERREEQTRLQEEVRVLEEAVNDNTCTLDDLSNSQLDLLERMLTSGTALRRATAPAHYPSTAPPPNRLRRGGSLEESNAHPVPTLPPTSSSALHRRRTFRQQSLLSRSNGSQAGGGPRSPRSPRSPLSSTSTSSSLENTMHRFGASPPDSAGPELVASRRVARGGSQGGRPSPRKQQLLNARSLEEHGDRVSEPISSVLHRLTSRSTSHLTHSSFPSSLVRGLGQLVRGHPQGQHVHQQQHGVNVASASSVSTASTSTAALHHHHHFQVQEVVSAPSSAASCSSSTTATYVGAGTGAAVATISQGILSPPPPPPPPPDL